MNDPWWENEQKRIDGQPESTETVLARDNHRLRERNKTAFWNGCIIGIFVGFVPAFILVNRAIVMFCG